MITVIIIDENGEKHIVEAQSALGAMLVESPSESFKPTQVFNVGNASLSDLLSLLSGQISATFVKSLSDGLPPDKFRFVMTHVIEESIRSVFESDDRLRQYREERKKWR